jgi:hypothetical protein
MTVQKQDALKFNNDFNRIKYRSNQWSKRAPSRLKMRINIKMARKYPSKFRNIHM